MNPARLAVLVTGMILVLLAGFVAYYATPLHNYVPGGVAVAVLLLVAGLFVMAISTTIRNARLLDATPDYDTIETVPATRRGRTRVINADRYDRDDDIEVIRH